MSNRERVEPVATTELRNRDEQVARWELLGHLQNLLEPVMVALGLAFLALLVIDFSGITLSPEQRVWLDWALTTIWAVFVADFLLRLVVAPEKITFLRTNWLSAASLALPFLRPLRALQAVRAVRSLSLVRLLGGANRGMRVLQRITAGRTLAYVAALTILATLLAAVGVLFFDRDAEGATIQTFGDALWWATAMVTTINNEKYAVTPEARVIAILLRVFAVSVFGFITASIASYLIGRRAEEQALAEETGPVLEEHLTAIQKEQAALRQDVAALREAIERLARERNLTRPLETNQALPASPSVRDDRLARPTAAPSRQPPQAR